MYTINKYVPESAPNVRNCRYFPASSRVINPLSPIEIAMVGPRYSFRISRTGLQSAILFAILAILAT